MPLVLSLCVSPLWRGELDIESMLCSLQQETPTHRVMLHVHARRAHTHMTDYISVTMLALTDLPHSPPYTLDRNAHNIQFVWGIEKYKKC